MTAVVETFVFRGSSNLSAATYDPEVENLTIDFQSGDTYTYFNVPPAVYRALTLSPSAGQYFWRHIKGVFNYERQ